MAYHRILSTVPCAVQGDLVIYPCCINQWASADPEPPPPLPLSSSPLATTCLVSVSLFLARDQPRLIQGIRRRDGVGEDQETIA